MASGVLYSYLRNGSECQDIAMDFHASNNATSMGVVRSTPFKQLALIMVLMIVINAVIALLFNYIRKRVFQDQDTLGLDFNAGGKVSMGLVAATIVTHRNYGSIMQHTPNPFLGLSGTFWYAAAGSGSLMLFAIVSLNFKTKAPGASTFLQVIRVRFGRPTHIIFIIFALVCNVVVLVTEVLGSGYLIRAFVPRISLELVTGMTAIVIGIFPVIGGLGATFYVSYFNIVVTFAIILFFMGKILHDPHSNPTGNMETMHQYMNCSLGPEGNLDESLITMVSTNGFLWGVTSVLFSFVFLTIDQTYWQISVAAKPLRGVWGYISAGLVYFAVLFTFGTVITGAYTALSAQEGEGLLSRFPRFDITNAGLSAAPVVQRLMGNTGEVLYLVLVLMAVTSTGAAEVMAFSSVVVYDIVQPYIQPFRKKIADLNTCVLCKKPRGRKSTPSNRCRCISMKACPTCKADNKANEREKVYEQNFKCKLHGRYREYTDFLLTVKTWTLMWTTYIIIPLTLILHVSKVTIVVFYGIFAICAASAVIPVILCFFWARLNAAGMISGAIGGLVLGLGTWLLMAGLSAGGLQLNIFTVGIMEGILVSLFGGGLITIVVTWVTNRNFTEAQALETWERTRDIDNPLSPWAELYARELQLSGSNGDSRPSQQEVTNACTGARMSAYVVAPILVLIILIIWPAAMQAVGVFDLSTFTHWMNVAQAWGIIAAVFILVSPVVGEVLDIRAALKEQKSESEFGTQTLSLQQPTPETPRGAWNRMKAMIGYKDTDNPSNQGRNTMV